MVPRPDLTCIYLFFHHETWYIQLVMKKKHSTAVTDSNIDNFISDQGDRRISCCRLSGLCFLGLLIFSSIGYLLKSKCKKNDCWVSFVVRSFYFIIADFIPPTSRIQQADDAKKLPEWHDDRINPKEGNGWS